MLGYGLMPYRPRSAKETTMTPLISLAAQKRHLSLYVCAVVVVLLVLGIAAVLIATLSL